MLSELEESLRSEFCPNYWIKDINLFDLTSGQFVSKRAMLSCILKNPKIYITDDWLEYTRYVRRNCCCYCGEIKQVFYQMIVDPQNEEDGGCCVCCRIDCSEYGNEFSNTQYMVDPLSLDVY